MLAIKNNIMAANAARHLGRSYDALATSVERLSSGLRINSARDDAAGLAVRELLRADVAVYQQAARNAADGVSMLQTAEGAMSQIDALLIRMKELAEQAATGSYSGEQRTIMNDEYSSLSSELTRIATSTSFNENELLNSTTSIDIHVGSGAITVTPKKMTATELGVDTTTGVKETFTHNHSVASADDLYITVAEFGGTGTDEFEFRFGTLTSETSGIINIDLDRYHPQCVGRVNQRCRGSRWHALCGCNSSVQFNLSYLQPTVAGKRSRYR